MQELLPRHEGREIKASYLRGESIYYLSSQPVFRAGITETKDGQNPTAVC
jgi:hypothetical protein